jgi:hypothetical protein
MDSTESDTKIDNSLIAFRVVVKSRVFVETIIVNSTIAAGCLNENLFDDLRMLLRRG